MRVFNKLFPRVKMKKSGLKLNLGCGRLIKTGYTNCDIQKYPGVDKVFDCSSLASFKKIPLI